LLNQGLNNYWQADTSVNFLSQAYFISFMKSKAENQLSFNRTAC